MGMIARFNRGNLVPMAVRGMDDVFRMAMGRWNDLAPELMQFSGAAPQLNIELQEKSVVATLPLSGCKPEDFNIEVVGDQLTVRVERENCACDDEEKHYLRRERSFEEFEESVSMPVEVVGAEAKAAYVDGVLTITIPRETKVEPKSHSVKVE